MRNTLISSSTAEAGTSIGFCSINPLITCCLTRETNAFFNSRSIFLRISTRKSATDLVFGPNLATNSSVNSGNTMFSTFFKVIANFATLPFKFSAWYSAGKVTLISNCSPALWPTIPSSKPGIIRPCPINNTKSDALPPSNSSPSTEPTKSIVTRSSAFAAESVSAQVACCLRNTSTILSISASVISTVGFSTLIFSKPCNLTSG